MIRILIADHSAIIQDGLASLLDSQADFQVVGTALDGLEAVEKASELSPNVVIMDACMPCLDGVEATRRIKHAAPNIGIIFFAVFVDRIEDCLTAGSDGFLLKDCEPAELYSAVRRVAA